MKKFVKLGCLGLFVIFAIGIFVFLFIKSRPKVAIYDIVTVEKGSVQNISVATGKVSPRDEILIKPQISGIVNKILKTAGDYVQKDEVIATVNVVPELSSLNSAESRVRVAQISLKQLKSEYDRQKQLFDKGVIARDEMDKAEADFRKAKEDLDNANESLDIIKTGISKSTAKYSNTQIRSTITGMILDVPIKEGNSVIQANNFNDGTTIATVANMNDMIFIGKIDETEVGRVRVGMPIKLSIGAIENQKFDASLEYISPKGTEENGAILFEIKAAVQVPDTVLVRAGYSANAEIVLAKTDTVLVVPESTVSFSNDSSFVYIFKNENTKHQEFDKRHVILGLSNGINIEIKEGLMLGDKIRGNEILSKSTTVSTN